MNFIEDTSIIDGQAVTLKIEVTDLPESSAKHDLYSGMRGGGTSAETMAIKKVQHVFDQGMQAAKDCAKQVVHHFNQMEATYKPDEIEAQFGINLGTKAGVVIAQASAQAHVQIKMKWKPQQAARWSYQRAQKERGNG